MDGFERITGREHDGLVEKCQENGWLKVGGFDWQDDPFLEEYPYEFSRTDSVDRLREALGSGNWAIRQGFCYRDLAFIQQVNGGDEWWTLKRDGDAWTGFESWSFGAIAQEPERFERAMRDMCEATPEQCRSGEWAHLHEKTPEPLAQRAASAHLPGPRYATRTILVPCTSETPSSRATDSAFSQVMPPPGKMVIRPAARSTNSRRRPRLSAMGVPAAPPCVRMRSTPWSASQSMAASCSSAGRASKAMWKVTST